MAIKSDRMMVWPSPFLFWTEVENHNKLKKDLLPKIKSESKKEHYHTTPGKINRRKGKNPVVWYCEVITSHFDMEESENIFTEEIKSLIIEDPLKQFYDDINCPVPIKPKKHILKDIWFNFYEPGYWQEKHTHAGSTYSGIYILELNEKNPTVFYNYSSSTFNYEKTMEPIYTTTHIKEGNVLLFPSEFVHSVNVCSNQRATISFNIVCE